MEWINTIIAVIALILGGFNLYLIYKQGKKHLDLELLKLQTEFGTIQDIEREINNLRLAHEQKRSEIIKKWNEEQ